MIKRFVVSALLIVSTVYLTGCFALFVGAAAGAGGVIWVTGKLQQDVNASVEKVHRAAIAALKKLELPVITDKKDTMTARIESQYVDGKHVWIDIDYTSQTSTKLSIRVGTLGDEVRSREILDQIKKRL